MKTKRIKKIEKFIESVNSQLSYHFLQFLSIKKIIKALKILFTKGPKGVIEKIKEKQWQNYHNLSINQQYQIWLKKNYPTKKELERQKKEGKKFKYRPLISIITPVYNTEEKWLRLCLDSLLKQTYDNWEMCLINDASTKPHVFKILKEYQNKDKRFKIKNLLKNVGISLASHEALLISKGEYVGLLDSDDELTPNALFEVVKLINKHKNKVDFIYSDEDKITPDGKLIEPFFKPDWSPNLLRSMMYTSHLTVYKKKLVIKVGGFNNKYNGSQDYDLALKISEITRNIYHIPKILYHWRIIPTSAAFKGDIKGYPILNAKKALEDHLKRLKIKGEVKQGFGTGRWYIKYNLNKYPAVSIILLTGGKINFLNNCLISILTKTTYKNYKIVVVDNSNKNETQKYLKAMKKVYKNKLIFYKNNLKPFNFPALCNDAIKKINTEFIILLNDDTEIITPNWIEEMLMYGQREDVGIVGCKLLYPNNTIQHAGVIFGVYGNSGHAFKGIPNNLHYYFDFPHVVRNVSAVTFACAMIKTKIYNEIGGLDEKKLKVAFNDTDFCLRARKKGYLIIYTPHAVLYHLESVTKPVHYLPGEVDYMKKRWKKVIENDPYYNPNLTRKKEDFSLNI
jgi:GT2 family glycosyltransferase